MTINQNLYLVWYVPAVLLLTRILYTVLCSPGILMKEKICNTLKCIIITFQCNSAKCARVGFKAQEPQGPRLVHVSGDFITSWVFGLTLLGIRIPDSLHYSI